MARLMTRRARASQGLAATAPALSGGSSGTLSLARPRVLSRVLSLALGLPLALAVPSGPAPAASAGLTFDRDPAWRQAADLPALVAHLEDWLDGATALPRRAAPPAIRIVPRDRALSLAGLPARGHGRHRGLYDARGATVYLVAPWSPDRAEDVAVLLHELVHHRQAARHWYCGAAQEPQAYRAQAAWLAEHGRALDWPELAVTLAAGCTPADIHPE